MRQDNGLTMVEHVEQFLYDDCEDYGPEPEETDAEAMLKVWDEGQRLARIEEGAMYARASFYLYQQMRELPESPDDPAWDPIDILDGWAEELTEE